MLRCYYCWDWEVWRCQQSIVLRHGGGVLIVQQWTLRVRGKKFAVAEERCFENVMVFAFIVLWVLAGYTWHGFLCSGCGEDFSLLLERKGRRRNFIFFIFSVRYVASQFNWLRTYTYTRPKHWYWFQCTKFQNFALTRACVQLSFEKLIDIDALWKSESKDITMNSVCIANTVCTPAHSISLWTW